MELISGSRGGWKSRGRERGPLGKGLELEVKTYWIEC